jgi:hypothetical protein
MTLHETVESAKKTWLGVGIGLAGVIVLVIMFKIGVVVKDIIFPPQVIPANQAYGALPPLVFPDNVNAATYKYTIDTLDGTLPTTGTGETELPDRLTIYKITHNPPDLLALDKTKAKIKKIDFVGLDGTDVPEIKLQEPFYEWDDSTGIRRKIIIDTFSYDFDLTSDYLTSLIVLTGQKISDQTAAITTVQEFLNDMQQFPADVDLEKTQKVDPNIHYTTDPQLFTITNGTLETVDSLSDAKVIRVDLYQKDIEYDLETGRSWSPTKKVKLPILYPNPPKSTMNFTIASGQNDLEVVEAHFKHQTIDRQPEEIATYPIKTAEEAFTELKEGKAYIAASPYSGSENQVQINNIYLAYYLGETDQEYLYPIFVFEDRKGFFAFVPAVKELPAPEGGTNPTETQ